jgi:hypothetical protein
MHAPLGGIVTVLHFQEQIHTDAECLFEAQGHLSGNRSLAVVTSDRVARPTPRITAALVTVKPRARIICSLIISPGCGGFFIAMVYPTSRELDVMFVIDLNPISQSLGSFIIEDGPDCP